MELLIAPIAAVMPVCTVPATAPAIAAIFVPNVPNVAVAVFRPPMPRLKPPLNFEPQAVPFAPNMLAVLPAKPSIDGMIDT